MIEKKEEGIVLQTLAYRESSRIISILTPQSGIIRLIAQQVSKKKSALIHLTTPLCRAHFTYHIKRSSLYRLIDGHALDLHLSLRGKYAFLREAGTMVRLILASQLQGKPSPLLYRLFLFSLRQLPQMAFPETLRASFLLKLLKHEGLLSLSPTCLRCTQRSSEVLQGGESLCSPCSSPAAFAFSKKEWELLSLLANTRLFAALQPLALPQSLAKSLDSLFEQLFP